MSLPVLERHSIRAATRTTVPSPGSSAVIAPADRARSAPDALPPHPRTVTRHRVLIADDHRILLEGLERLLQPRYEVVGRASNGAELIELAPALGPDLIITDYSMPEVTGVEAVRALRGRGDATPIVMLTVHEDPAYAQEAFAAGVNAYVPKREASSDLLVAMDAALAGDTWLSPSLSSCDLEGPAQKAPSPDALSDRQRHIAGAIAKGQTARQIAESLGLSRKTVEYHKYKLMRDLGLESSAELIRFAVEHGLDGAS